MNDLLHNSTNASSLTPLVVAASHREQVAEFFEPSIGSIREYFKSMSGQLDPRSTVTIEIPSTWPNSYSRFYDSSFI